MQIINNKALYMNSTLRKLSHIPCDLNRSDTVLEGMKIGYWGGVGGNVRYYNGLWPSNRPQYINRHAVHLCTSVVLKRHCERKMIRGTFF